MFFLKIPSPASDKVRREGWIVFHPTMLMNVIQASPFGNLVQSRGQVSYRESGPADTSPALSAQVNGASLLTTSTSAETPETLVAPRRNAAGSSDKSSDSTKVRTSKALLDLYA